MKSSKFQWRKAVNFFFETMFACALINLGSIVLLGSFWIAAVLTAICAGLSYMAGWEESK